MSCSVETTSHCLPQPSREDRFRLREYESRDVQKTLDNAFVPGPIREARLMQDQMLLERFQGRPLRIADIGCGDGYHGELFAPYAASYHGFEISSEMAEQTRSRWQHEGLHNTQVFEGDASKMFIAPNSYDVAWSLYFTSGNFRDQLEDLSEYTDAYLDKNPAFINIIGNFYHALRWCGKMFLTVYKDNPETQMYQRAFYANTGQTVLTPPGSRFVATAENFWSVRWTKESMLSNLRECGIHPNTVVFHDLNEIAWLVEITKI